MFTKPSVTFCSLIYSKFNVYLVSSLMKSIVLSLKLLKTENQ